MSNKHPLDVAILNSRYRAAFDRLENVRKRLGLPSQAERQAQAAAEAAARKAEEDAFYRGVANNLANSVTIAPVYTNKEVDTSINTSISDDMVTGFKSGLNNLAQAGVAVADTVLTNQVVRPINSIHHVITGSNEPLISSPATQSSVGGKVVNAGILQGLLKNAGIFDAQANEEALNKQYSEAYREQSAEIEEAVKDIQNPFLRSVATFGHSLTKPNVVASGIAAAAPSTVAGGVAGRAAMAAIPSLSASSAAALGTGVVSAANEMGDTAKGKGGANARDMVYDLTTGALVGATTKVMPSKLSAEVAITRGSLSRGMSSRGKEIALETGQEYIQSGIESALNQKQKTGQINWGQTGQDAGMGAAIGTATSAGLAVPSLLGDGVSELATQKSRNKTNPEHKNYDPVYTVNAANRVLNSNNASFEQVQEAIQAKSIALQTALAKLEEYDAELASMPAGKEKDKLQKERDQYFNKQVNPIQSLEVQSENESELTPDEAFERVMRLSQDVYARRKTELQTQLSDAVNYQPEIPQYTNNAIASLAK